MKGICEGVSKKKRSVQNQKKIINLVRCVQLKGLEEEKEGFAPLEGDVVAYVPSGHRLSSPQRESV